MTMKIGGDNVVYKGEKHTFFGMSAPGTARIISETGTSKDVPVEELNSGGCLPVLFVALTVIGGVSIGFVFIAGLLWLLIG